MSPTLRYIADDLITAPDSGVASYTRELGRALVATAPEDLGVEAVVAAATEEHYGRLAADIPGLAGVHKSPLARRELQAAWRTGLGRIARGVFHAPSLFAPLAAHDRVRNPGNQVVVTVHDVLALTRPQWFPAREVEWQRAMLRRAERFADAIVVPSHATAAVLAELGGFGDRVRVINAAPRSDLALPAQPDQRAAELGLPAEYVLARGDADPRYSVSSLVAAVARSELRDVHLVVVGQADGRTDELVAHALEVGLPRERLHLFAGLSTSDENLVLARARLLVAPALGGGRDGALLEAFALGVPVIHSDAPVHLEEAGGAGLAVPSEPIGDYPARLAAEIARLWSDPIDRERLRIAGRDRARAFSWRDAAERVWELHAEL